MGCSLGSKGVDYWEAWYALLGSRGVDAGKIRNFMDQEPELLSACIRDGRIRMIQFL